MKFIWCKKQLHRHEGLRERTTTMKLRKSLVRPVAWHNISSCSVLPPEIVMQDAFNVIH